MDCAHCRMLVRVVDVQVGDDGWSAVLCDPDEPSEQWTIGRFTWGNECFFTVVPNYWHFPMLGERYLFDENYVAAVRRGKKRLR